MFQKFSGRSAILVHASLGLLFFAYMGAVQVGSYAELRGRQLISEVDKERIQQEQMTAASRISLVFSSAFFFMMSVWLMTHQTEMNFGLVQRSCLSKRLDFCMTLSLYICFFSALFNAIQLMDDDNLLLKNLEGEDTVLDLGRPIEWMLTCPLMQLAVPILGGEKVPDSRRVFMPLAAFTVLSFGLLSTLMSNIALKALMYGAGCLVFLAMLYLMNSCVMDASNGGENIFTGSSFLRGIVVVIASTWFPFPIWYALSPEGFNIIQDEAGMKVAVAFLNVFSKGAFIMYLARIRTDHNTRQATMLSVGYMTEANKGSALEDLEGADDKMSLDKITTMLIKEVLESMGRGKDHEQVIEILQAHLITSNDDILALTKEYCTEIGLPWGLMLALKSKIRSYRVQLDDPWSMQTSMGAKNKSGEPVEVSFSAPHIAKNEEKIKVVARRQSSIGELPALGRDDLSDKASNPGYPSSSRSTAPSLPPAAFGADAPGTPQTVRSGFSAYSPPKGKQDPEFARLSALIEEHQKSVNGQVDETRQFVMQSMDRVMDVLEQRLTEVNKSAAAPSSTD
jgi:bacteriorhodopsin